MERKAHQVQMEDNPLNDFVCKTLAALINTAINRIPGLIIFTPA
jgi:hypothetical protein